MSAQVLWTVMRHFLRRTPFPVSVLAKRVGKLPVPSPLVPSPSLAQRASPSGLGAATRAVAVPAVAPGTQEEHLPAVGEVADDEAK